MTATKTSTKTKVIVGLLLAGGAIAAFGAGWVWKVKVNGVPVLSGNTATGDIQVGPTIPKQVESSGELGDSTNFNTNSDSNSNSSNSNTNSGGNTNVGSTPTGGN